VADELVVATVTAAEPQPGARAPALLLTLDLGTYGQEEAVVGGHDADAVVGTQLVCRRESNGVVVVAARSHAKGDVALRPDRDVEPGTLVS
jgi:tRNA-binding EMAP/Myf-like protein